MTFPFDGRNIIICFYEHIVLQLLQQNDDDERS